MNGPEPQSIPAPSAPPRGDSNKEEWSLRSCGEDAKEQSAGSDAELVPGTRGFRTSSLECSMEPIAREHCSKEDNIPQTKEASSPAHFGTLEKVAAGNLSPSLEPDVSWILNRASSVQSSANLGCDAPAEHNKDIAKPCLSTSPGIRNDPIIIPSSDHGVDSKTAGVSSTVGYNPFHPYKKLGPVKHVDASECGSTTGPLEESEPLKKWKQMKENGFLSLSHGGIPLPKQQARQARKRRRDATKKKKSPKMEHVSRFTKFTAPSGLLSGLDPGIIKHVRNSKQVHSIIEAMVRSEKYDGQIQNKFPGPAGIEGTKETHLQRKYQNCSLDSAANQSALSPEKTSVPLVPVGSKINELNVVERRFHYGACTSQFTADNDTLALKLPSDVSMGSDNVSSASRDDLSNQDNLTCLSLKGATVAFQWLELIQLDIQGRLMALRRSKKRAKNTVQTELPFLVSTVLHSDIQNGPAAGCPTLDVHMARWTSLFSQTDTALYDEANHLESWLRQVQEMQVHCERGLRCVGADVFSEISRFVSFNNVSPDTNRPKIPDEMERAVVAAAASLYSTCNFIGKENVPCFLAPPSFG